jgi:NAD(P)-dependent dehydrogenase (short-subunit alcohol dehydrogenase family)
MSSNEVWFITGANRGIGAEIVEAALAKGHAVVATARDRTKVLDRFPDAGDRLLAVELDVREARTIADAVDAALAVFGRIDVLVNNAGHGLLGAVEEASDEAVRDVYATNVFGVLNVQRAVLPVLRRQRSGHVVQMSSVGGFVSAPGWGIYASTKFAVEGFSEALADELAPLGIGVTIVEPGYVRTDFLDATSLRTQPATIEDYAQTPAGAMRELAAAVNHAQPGNPVRAAEAIVAAVDGGAAPRRLQLGSDCVAAVEGKARAVLEELDAHRAIAAGVDYAAA